MHCLLHAHIIPFLCCGTEAFPGFHVLYRPNLVTCWHDITYKNISVSSSYFWKTRSLWYTRSEMVVPRPMRAWVVVGLTYQFSKTSVNSRRALTMKWLNDASGARVPSSFCVIWNVAFTDTAVRMLNMKPTFLAQNPAGEVLKKPSSWGWYQDATSALASTVEERLWRIEMAIVVCPRL